MLELGQTEWCPVSQRVRQRLTELGVDYVTRQVPVAKEQRDALRETTGSDTIPALVLQDGSTFIGEGAIRLKAAKARRRYLEECECSPARTP